MPVVYWTAQARQQLELWRDTRGQQRRYQAVVKAIRLLVADPGHPDLQTHEYTSLKGPGGERVFEAYAALATPAAYRIFWYYGPKKDQLTLVAITPHP
jgi:hypothetical protein